MQQTIQIGTQLDLIEHGVFNNDTYEPLYSGYAKLRGINKDLFELMRDGKYRSLDEIEKYFKSIYQQTSISAGLRNLRKPQFGAHTVNKKQCDSSKQYKYQLITAFI